MNDIDGNGNVNVCMYVCVSMCVYVRVHVRDTIVAIFGIDFLHILRLGQLPLTAMTDERIEPLANG